MCVNLMEFCVFIFFEKITEAFGFVDQQHFVNKKQHLFLWIRNSILLAFVLALPFIAIRANKTSIICKIDRPGDLGEPPISDKTYGHVDVQI